jgi:hypothetical protein
VVYVFEVEDAAWVRSFGGMEILYSEAAAEEFVRWVRGRGWRLLRRKSRSLVRAVCPGSRTRLQRGGVCG